MNVIVNCNPCQPADLLLGGWWLFSVVRYWFRSPDGSGQGTIQNGRQPWCSGTAAARRRTPPPSPTRGCSADSRILPGVAIQFLFDAPHMADRCMSAAGQAAAGCVPGCDRTTLAVAAYSGRVRVEQSKWSQFLPGMVSQPRNWAERSSRYTAQGTVPPVGTPGGSGPQPRAAPQRGERAESVCLPSTAKTRKSNDERKAQRIAAVRYRSRHLRWLRST